MSLDMTMGKREAALDSAGQQNEAEAAPVARFWLRDLAVVTATGFGVLLSSAIAVLLFIG